MILTLAAFIHLAAECGPSVHVDTLASVAQTESRLDTAVIHDNTTGRTYHPGTDDEAIRLATGLVTTDRHSLDLGLMQVNSANFARLGLSIADAFDPCKNIAGGARVLTEAYQPTAADADPQPAVLRALSRYNTGDPARGFANGYVQKVQASAEQVVPAIHVEGSPSPSEDGPEKAEPMPAPGPPAWDVYGQARYRRAARTRPPAGSGPATAMMPEPAASPVQLQPAPRAADGDP